MPPKSSIAAAALKNPNNKLAAALNAGGNQDNMLAMTYSKADHRAAGTTGSHAQIKAVRNKITDSIAQGKVVDTYKYSVMATNTGTITSKKRNFGEYAEAYINKLENNGVMIPKTEKNTIRKWTKTVLPNEQKTLNDNHFKTLIDKFNHATKIQ